MKFLHLSTGDTRGAFTAAYRLHRNLIAEGHQSVMLVGDKQSDDPTVIAPPKPVQLLGRMLLRAVMNQALRLVCGREGQARHYLTFNVALVPARYLVKALGSFRPDLVVVHYTSGFLSPATLLELKKSLNAPVAVYLMDMEMLTGACHYAWDCKGYASGCEDCPVPKTRLLKRWVRGQWEQRRKSLQQIDPVVVAGSGWLMRQAAASTLTREFERSQILLGIDPQRYAPGDRRELRRKFGLPENALVLYFGAQNLADPRKGYGHLREALKLLATELSSSERETVVLFTVGKSDRDIAGDLPFTHVHRTYIADPGLFASTYAAADLFICPSVEDSGPMMINEAVVSGTPVVAFEMGVAVNLVVNGETGFRVPLGDARALAAAVAGFIRLPAPQRASMSAACRTLGLAASSNEAQSRAFVDLAKTAAGKVS